MVRAKPVGHVNQTQPLVLTFMGDSKTTSTLWTSKLIAGLRSISNWSSVTEAPTRLATAGWRVADLDSAATAWLAAATDVPHVVFVNIGVNDSNAATSQSSFETSFASILDKIHTKWADAVIFVAKVWRGDSGAAETKCDLIDDTWMPNVMATRAWADFGLDERLVIRDPDGGVSKTMDLVHYNSTGDTAIANACQALVEGTLL